MKRYRQRRDGEWVPFDLEGHLVACCDCGLVHRVHVRAGTDAEGRERLEFMAIRMPRQTAGRRAAITRRRRTIMPERVVEDQDILTDRALREFLLIEDGEYPESYQLGRIQTCAGEWQRMPDGRWRFAEGKE